MCTTAGYTENKCDSRREEHLCQLSGSKIVSICDGCPEIRNCKKERLKTYRFNDGTVYEACGDRNKSVNVKEGKK